MENQNKTIYVIDRKVVGVITLYVEDATSKGPVGATEYVVDVATPVDVGWLVSGTEENPVFTEGV